MFAPAGYVPFSDFAEEINEHSFHFFNECASPKINRMDPKKRSEDLRAALWGAGLFAGWLLDICLVHQPIPIYLASPSGALVRAAKNVFLSRAKLSQYIFDWPLERNKDEFLEWLRVGGVALYEIEKNYLVLDNSFCIEAKRKVSNDVSDPQNIAPRIIANVKPFDGWCVCIREDETKILRAAIQSAYVWPVNRADNQASELNLIASSTRLGRSRKVDDVRNFYDVLYPDGHEAAGVTMKMVVIEIERMLRKPCSVDTLKRAIGKRN